MASRNAAARRSLRDTIKATVWDLAPRVYARWQKPVQQEFSIGIYTGPAPTELSPAAGISNPVISRRDIVDVPALLAADPFLHRGPGGWHMFFEVIEGIERKGFIAMASSEDALNWRYDGIVLKEPFHLSYPHVFEHDGEIWMLPETGAAGEVRLYRATDFPYGWRHAHTLLQGSSFVDSSIFRFGDLWWLMTHDRGSVALRLYWAEDPLGPWQEHPSSPIVEADRRIERPAGRVVVTDGQPVRFAQSGYPEYGTEVLAVGIAELTPTSYTEQVPEVVLTGGADTWNRSGMHHVDAHRLSDGSWLACVDGW